MVRIIVSVVLLVLAAVLVPLNLEYRTSINLFGARFDGVPVLSIAAWSFVLGVVYSLFIYVGRYLRRKAKKNLAARNQNVAEREQALESQRAELERTAGQAPAEGGAQEPAQGDQAGTGSGLSKLWRRFTSRS